MLQPAACVPLDAVFFELLQRQQLRGATGIRTGSARKQQPPTELVARLQAPVDVPGQALGGEPRSRLPWSEAAKELGSRLLTAAVLGGRRG